MRLVSLVKLKLTNISSLISQLVQPHNDNSSFIANLHIGRVIADDKWYFMND